MQTTDGHEWLAGHAGELHPRVIGAFGLPARTAAMELDLSVIETAADKLGPVQAPVLSSYPAAVQDVALTVDAAVPSVEVERALAAGAAAVSGLTLEDLKLFDVYTGDQAGAAEVAGLLAAVPGARPDAHGGGGQRGQGGRGRRGRAAHRRRAQRQLSAEGGRMAANTAVSRSRPWSRLPENLYACGAAGSYLRIGVIMLRLSSRGAGPCPWPGRWRVVAI